MITREPVREEPELSVIVPARNEEACLGRCLESLTGQTGVSFEVLVVDDGSTDRTREIALGFAGVQVVGAPALPLGWSGKNNALTAGAGKACGKWLLFTDADTVHLPGSLARSLAEAKERKADLLSYSPEQEVHGFWEKAVMPVIFAELASTYKPAEVSDPASPAAAANGQYLLVWREAYDAVGGHAAVGSSLLEDVALARAVKKSGRKIFFRFGGDAVRTHMYRGFRELREGWTKNLVLLFPSPMQLAVLRATEFLLILGCAAEAVHAARAVPRIAAVTAAASAVLYLLFLGRIRKAYFSWDADLAAILGLPIFSYLLWRSKLSYKQGRVAWKGRTYAQSSGVQG